MLSLAVSLSDRLTFIFLATTGVAWAVVRTTMVREDRRRAASSLRAYCWRRGLAALVRAAAAGLCVYALFNRHVPMGWFLLLGASALMLVHEALIGGSRG